MKICNVTLKRWHRKTEDLETLEFESLKAWKIENVKNVKPWIIKKSIIWKPNELEKTHFLNSQTTFATKGSTCDSKNKKWMHPRQGRKGGCRANLARRLAPWGHGRIPMENLNLFYDFSIVWMDFNTSQWIAIGFNGYQWISMDFMWFAWFSMDWNRLPTTFIRCYTVSMDLNWFHLILIVFNRFQ